MRFLPTHPPEPADWLVDVWFRGLKTGRTIHRRIGVSPHHDEATAILWAWRTLNIHDPERVVDCRANRRSGIETPATTRDKLRIAAQQYTRAKRMGTVT